LFGGAGMAARCRAAPEALAPEVLALAQGVI
jgi:hypothetical protein